MWFKLSRLLAVITICVPALAFAAKPKPCVPAGQAAQMLNKDICVSAHVYNVVQLPDGTRFLDVCSPQTTDEQCRFTVVSFEEDRTEVGELKKYRDADVRDSRHRAAYARPGGHGPEPCQAVLRRSAEVQAQSTARAGLQRGAGTAAGERSQSAQPGRRAGVYEHQESGDVAGEIERHEDGFAAGARRDIKPTVGGSPQAEPTRRPPLARRSHVRAPGALQA